MLTTERNLTTEIKMIGPELAKEVCNALSSPLPEWMRIPESIQNRMFFAAARDDEYVGIIIFELSAPKNVHINCLILKQANLLESVGAKLLSAVENDCYQHGYSSVTLETLSPYLFYEKLGYKPLFESYVPDKHQVMVYMQKMISLADFTFIDLTHSLSTTVPHWGIDVGFKYNARNIQTVELPGNAKFRVQRLEMSAGIGTHMDAPSHCFEHAAAIDAIPIESLIAVCRVIDVSSKAHERYSVSLEDVLAFEETHGMIPEGAFVIIYTGWDQRWEQPEKYRNEKIFPNLSIAAAELLLARNVIGIGIDTLSPDMFGSDFPVHRLMLGAGKYIIENVANAKQLDPAGSFIFAFPIKVVDGTEAPIRLVGMKRK